MEIKGFESLPKLFVSQTEMMDEFTGSVKEFESYSMSLNVIIQLEACINKFATLLKNSLTNKDCSLYGLDFTKDEQITNGIHRTNENYRKLQFPKTIQGMLISNRMKKSFNFLKSLNIAALNNEIELIRPSKREFWGDEEIRTDFLGFLQAWSKNPVAFFKKMFAAQDGTHTIQQANKEVEIEVGFVAGLFEMYRLKGDIARARVEFIADSVVSTYNHINLLGKCFP